MITKKSIICAKLYIYLSGATQTANVKINGLEITIDGYVLKRVNSCKYLGIYFDR